MPDRYQETHIRHVPMFAQLPEPQFQLVAQSFEVRRYNAGDYILTRGSDVPGLMILAEGQAMRIISTPDGRMIQQGIIHEGQFVFQNSLFEPQRTDVHLQAARPTTVLLLSRAAMGNLLSHHPELKPAFGLDKGTDHHLHDVHFKTQRENEKVLLKTRRHWFAMMRWMWMPIVFVVLGLVASVGLPAVAVFSVPIVFIVAIVWAIYIVLEWANDAVIITDQRVIRITHTIVTFHEVRDEVALESIQEANSEIPAWNIFARIFDYGDIELRTAGAQGNFTLDRMPHPNQMQELIIEDARQYRVATQSREREAMVAEVERWIQEPDFRAGQAQSEQPQATFDDVANRADDGPLSPFVTSFKLREGGIVYRKHWFQWIKTITTPTLCLIGSFALAIMMFVFAPMQTLGAIGWAITFLTFLIGVVWFYLADWDWRHDYYVVTDNNITIVNRRPLWLQDESDQVLLKQVDNVVSETKGIFQQMLRFGDVKVSLVGADHHKLFDNVPNPLSVQGEITRRQLRLKEREQQESQQLQREIVGEYISLYHQQSQQPNPQIYPDDKPLPYQPKTNQATAQQYPQQAQQPSSGQYNVPSSRPSPLGNRPSISSGRPYHQEQHQPQSYPAQPPQYQQPGPPQQYQPTGQGQRPQAPQPNQTHQQGEQGQIPNPPQPYRPDQQRGQKPPPPPGNQQGEQKPPPPPMPPNFNP